MASILYELNHHYHVSDTHGEILVGFSVTTITVSAFQPLADGSTKIEGRDSTGNLFQGTLSNYYLSADQAWLAALEIAKEETRETREEIDRLQCASATLHTLVQKLATMPKDKRSDIGRAEVAVQSN